MNKGLKNCKKDFPLLSRQVNHQPLVYLDNAATTQKPQAVIQRIVDFYQQSNANVHRSVNTLSLQATEQYEQARSKVQHWIKAAKPQEIIFTRGATEAVNFIASTYGADHIQAQDEIVVTVAEHHSNLVPWQQLAKARGAQLKYIKVDAQGHLDLQDAAQKITARTKIVACTQVSNVLGTIFPLKQIAALAHQQGAIVIGDGSQAVPVMAVNVQDLDVDFYVFSGHKMLGPSGIGVLYGKEALLQALTPYQYGGEMINEVDWEDSTFSELPSRLEAGTPNIEGAIGLGAAIDYLDQLSIRAVTQYEQKLMQYLLPQLQALDDVQLLGSEDWTQRTGIVSLNLGNIHPHDVATVLDFQGIEVRAGHHCAQPLMRFFNVTATVRASFYIYNTKEDIDRFVAALKMAKEFFEQ
ncbi:MAG: cysteine desulfurase [Bombilactobacillus mellifer]|uniref:cysteine desulfurase n=1 Tax=Bombilactobacillus mellifer TaxID=1218492 RepID=UPI0018DBBAEB|nr:cysteine desulfurase [Bombilactobacillus mellifer]MBH9991310.1 cysteine desulfurase [Lactobacillus sp. W8092]MCT6826365.1 cysteine desulfurase [Bombilactobacillus mellifer]MCT6844278.1 cysteine desulfurase [Bombilactobacillus mellifer]MCT6894838.1 cysteine desulfurase [Bombilactobacillus mellifer]